MYEATVAFGMCMSIALSSDEPACRYVRDLALLQGEWRLVAHETDGKRQTFPANCPLGVTIKGNQFSEGFLYYYTSTMRIERTGSIKRMHLPWCSRWGPIDCDTEYQVTNEFLRLGDTDSYFLFKRVPKTAAQAPPDSK